MSKTHREAISKASMGKPGTNKGRRFSDTWKQNISKSEKGKIGLRGSENPNWKGGRSIIRTSRDRKEIFIRTGVGKRSREHRIMMETKLKRKLKRFEVVHHKDGNPLNNSLVNLRLYSSQSKHVHEESRLRRFAKKLLFGDLAPSLKPTLRNLYKKVI